MTSSRGQQNLPILDVSSSRVGVLCSLQREGPNLWRRRAGHGVAHSLSPTLELVIVDRRATQAPSLVGCGVGVSAHTRLAKGEEQGEGLASGAASSHWSIFQQQRFYFYFYFSPLCPAGRTKGAQDEEQEPQGKGKALPWPLPCLGIKNRPITNHQALGGSPWALHSPLVHSSSCSLVLSKTNKPKTNRGEINRPMR